MAKGGNFRDCQSCKKVATSSCHVHLIVDVELAWLRMGEATGDKRPSWTSFLTLDHPLAIFCPHHAEHKRKKEAEAAAAMVQQGQTIIIPSTQETSNDHEPAIKLAAVTEHGNPSVGSTPTANTTTSSASGCPVMATTPSAESSCGGYGPVSSSVSEGGGATPGSGSAAKSACPVSPESRSVWASLNPSNNMMVEERQMPSPGQETPLPTVCAELSRYRVP